MLSGYQNFQLSMFVTVPDIKFMAAHPDKMEEQLAFYRKHLKLNKLYLELYRSEMVELDQYLFVKDYLEKQGMEISAAFTACRDRKLPNGQLVSDCLCYNNPKDLNKMKDLFETMAKHFDYILLDDYVFSNCTCETCRTLKGDRSWEEYRLDLIPKACNEYMIKPAKAVNPNVKITLKYPTWHESYQRTGYNTTEHPYLFDEIYSGTETRNAKYTLFRNPRYTSYSLMKYISSLGPKNNRGNWYDVFGDVNVIDILEQAYLSLFSDPREMTLYCWGEFMNTMYIPALGFELDRIDNFLGKIGKGVGIPIYLPCDSSGEDHIYDFMGMCGIPTAPTSVFPEEPCMVGLTLASTCDPDLINKIRKHLEKGGEIFLTHGCLAQLQDQGLSEFTGFKARNDVMTSNEFGVPNPAGFDNAGYGNTYYKGDKEVSMQVIDFKVNEGSLPVVQNKPGFPNPLLASNRYTAGRIYVFNVPQTWTDLYHIPVQAMDIVRSTLSKDLDVWMSAPAEIAIFPRDNHSVIIESFLDYASCAELHIKGDVSVLRNVETGMEFPRKYFAKGESVFLVPTQKTNFGVYEW